MERAVDLWAARHLGVPARGLTATTNKLTPIRMQAGGGRFVLYLQKEVCHEKPGNARPSWRP